MMKKLCIAFCLFLISCSTSLLADDGKLPGKHSLKQNEAGEFYVENHENIIMIESSILQIGYSDKWIVACIKNESIDTDLKRMVFINVKLGGTTDSINRENWLYFAEKLDGLADVQLKKISEEDCP